MDVHLLFHLVPKEDWKKAKSSNRYHPESLDNEGYIHLSKGDQLEKTANKFYKGTSDLVLLVIDRIRIESPLKYEDTLNEGEKFPHLYGELNMEAVIDTITLQPDSDGTFSIEVESD